MGDGRPARLPDGQAGCSPRSRTTVAAAFVAGSLPCHTPLAWARPRLCTPTLSSYRKDRAFAPNVDNRCRGLKGKGPCPSPRRSLGPVLAPSGLRCGPRWAGGGFGEGKWCFPQLQRKANSRYPLSSGGKRNGAKPSSSPHRDGSGRRQIPKLFFGAGKGHRLGSQ